jgi:hypothetical protein
LVCELYHQLEPDQFFSQRLPPSRKAICWDLILQTLFCYRLLDPGSEWHLHREWFLHSSMADLLGSDFSLVESHKLYRVRDRCWHTKRSFSVICKRAGKISLVLALKCCSTT